ncbi:hypothetical protein D3C73_1223140 [compost metagenome]
MDGSSNNSLLILPKIIEPLSGANFVSDEDTMNTTAVNEIDDKAEDDAEGTCKTFDIVDANHSLFTGQFRAPSNVFWLNFCHAKQCFSEHRSHFCNDTGDC